MIWNGNISFEGFRKKIDNWYDDKKKGECIMKKRGTLGLVFDFIMTFLTGGLWLIWLLIRYLRQS